MVCLNSICITCGGEKIKTEYSIPNHELTIGLSTILMLGWAHFQSTRRRGESFCPEGLNGSITASICKAELALLKMTALQEKR